MLTGAVVAVEAVVILLLLGALIVGQPAAFEQTRLQRDSLATQVAIQAHPAPTPTRGKF